MPTHHDEPLLERYQREHRTFEGMSMSKALQLANQTAKWSSTDCMDAASELRSLSAINAELLEALEAMKHKLRIDDPLDMYDSVCAAIAKAQGEQT